MKNFLDEEGDLVTNPLQRTLSNISDDERVIIENHIKKNNYKKMLNIGTYNGYTILKIKETFPDLELTSIDYIPNEDDDFLVSPVGGSYSKKGNRNRYDNIEKHLRDNNIGNILLYIDGSDAFFEANKKTFDIIFIDGDHSYEISKRDLENALQVINKNGLIVMHDIKDVVGSMPREESCAKTFDEYKGRKEFLKTKHGLGVIYE